MSKNIARKGVALGAASALLLAGFTSAPAQAAGVDGTSQLVPTTGYAEGWAVPATATATFSSTFTTTDTGTGTIKFKVEDPTATIEPDVTSSGRAFTVADNSVAVITIGPGTTDVITITDAALAPTLSTGDVIMFDDDLPNDDATGITTLASDDIAFSVTVVGNDISFTTDLGLATQADLSALINDASATGKVIREARATDNSFVVDTGITAAVTAALVLLSTSGAASTRSATVFGWVDNAALLNDTVDSIESTSSTETITFAKVSEITAVTALTAPVAGDRSLSATITTVPVLNGAQLTNNTSAIGQGAAKDFIRAVFTRQDSVEQAVSDSAVQSTVDGSWEASLLMTVNEGMAALLTTGKIEAQAGWGFVAPDATLAEDSTADIIAISVTAAKVATVTTTNAHALRTGDKVTVVSADLASADETSAEITVTSTTTFTYNLTTTAAVTAATGGTVTDTQVTPVTYADAPTYATGRVFAGTHSARALISLVDDATDADETYSLTGALSTAGTLAVASAEVSMSTTASATVAGSVTVATDSNRDAFVKAGTTSVTVTGTVLDSKGAALGAGRSVAFIVTRSSATTKVNGKTTSGTAVTDANGQVSFVVTDTLGTNGTTVTIAATAENLASSSHTLEWATQAFGLYDLSTSAAAALATSTRTMAVGGSYTLDLLLADQFAIAPSAGDYRIAVSGSGVTGGFVNFSDGKATLVVTDSQVATSFDTTLQLQKKGTNGLYAASGAAVVLTNNTTSSAKITLATDASGVYASLTADLSDAVAAKALVERDTRVAFTSKPAYGASAGLNEVLVTGRVTNSTSGAALGFAVVTITGANNILFSNGAVDKRGSITVIADNSGDFSVALYSTTAQKDSVITVNAAGSTAATTKVTFTGIGVGEGTSLVVTMPAAVKPASTFQVKAKLADVFGNGVETADGAIKVTYSGAGIVFGTLPTKTDANGELMFSVLLGSNDTGSVNVTVQYNQNGDTDFTDAKDLTTAGSTAITASGTVAASSDTIVNVGTFSGKLVVYALNAAGSEVSYKIAGKWVTQVVTSDLLMRYDRVVGATGKTIKVDIYVDGVLKLAKSVVTK
jgi:hypothetical protein